MPAEQPCVGPAQSRPFLQQASEAAITHTIHRVSVTHHGATLALLGHAAEYLQPVAATDPSRREAIHILRRLSRQIFDDYAQTDSTPHHITDWVMRRALRIYGIV